MESVKISKTLFDGIEDHVFAKRSKKSILKAILSGSLALGLLLVLILLNLSDKSPLYFGIVLFIVLFSVGTIFQAFFGEKTYVYKPTQKQLKERVVYFENGKALQVIQFLKRADLESLFALKVNSESGVRLDLLYSADATYGRCQVLTYASYVYEPMSEVIDLDPVVLAKIIDLLKK